MAEPRVQHAASAVPTEGQQVEPIPLRVLADSAGGVTALGELQGHPLPQGVR
jgi:hypothetical protein